MMLFDQMTMLRTQADKDALANLVRRFSRPNCIEIGSWAGESAHDMLRGGARQIYCIDTWEGSPNDTTVKICAALGKDVVYETFLKNMAPWIESKTIVPVRMDSLEAAKFWPPPPQMDFIYIDADHSYDSCKADIAAWWPHVREGGILAGHDYCPTFVGVINAVNEFGKCEVVPGSSVWWRRKC